MNRVLTSWKEIAQYLGKGVRTVQRWEREYGLPVRRLKSESHRAVLAIPEEIDGWVHSQTATESCELERLRNEVERLRIQIESLQQKSDLRHKDKFLPRIGVA